MDVITAVNAAVAMTPIYSLQRSSDPSGFRLSLRARPVSDSADLMRHHDSIVEEAGRRGLARDVVLGLVEKACNAARDAPQDNRSIYFVRAPVAMIAEEQFRTELERTVDAQNMDRARICLEIPETHPIESYASVIDSFQRLVGMGFLMSLANFGTGLSSVAWLKLLPVAYVQIAPAFVSEMLHDSVSREMVREFNELAHLTGRRTIGAGADSHECLMMLRNLGVDYAEGPAIAI